MADKKEKERTIATTVATVAKFPLLLGAVLAYALAIYEETVTDNTEVLVGVGGLVVGSVLLGTWLALFIIDFERRWERVTKGSGPPPRSDGGGPDAPSEGNDGSVV